MPTFDEFREVATAVAGASLNGDPPDVQQGHDAAVVAMTLFDWIKANVDEDRQAEIAAKLDDALGLVEVPDDE